MCSCVQVINDTKIVKARKDYIDSCMEFIMEVINDIRRGYPKMLFAEKRLIVNAINERWKIRKGELHEVQINKMDGEIYAFRSKIGLSKICSKYDLWGDC